MYAGSGYFDGSILTNATIEAAKIRTATIEGTGNEDGADNKFGLTIQDVSQGLQFRKDSDTNPYVTMTDEAFNVNIPLEVSELRIKKDVEVNFDKLSFAGAEDSDGIISNGIALQSNYLRFWENGKSGLFSMDGDGLAFTYHGNKKINKDTKWEMKNSDGYSKKITLGNNIVLGSAEEKNAPDLVLWGGMVLGETTRVTRVDDGFDIYVT